ncbi:MAG TPA: zinc ribbon domain-containing protein [Ktedonobacterales bacterium]|nr:zinc ribbon domain-containing protein [Ktedonobacterales bacterium]
MHRCAFCQGELDPATLICRACGRVQPIGDDDITLVPEPGARGTLSRHCPNCNELLPASARFCGRCGHTLIPLTDGAAGRMLHDTGVTEDKPRDYASTDVLNRSARLAGIPREAQTSPEDAAASPGALADTATEAPKVSVAVGQVGNGALRRNDGGARQGPSGVAHGLRFRLLSRMQARIVVSALVALLVVGGAVGVQSGLLGSQRNISNNTSTPTAVVVTATPTPTPPAGAFLVTPGSFAQTCAGTAALPQLAVTLDNSAGSSPVTWQVTITQTDPQGHLWGTASPKSGTLASGAKATLSITPITSLCQEMQGSGSLIMFSVTVSYTQNGESSSQRITDTVTPPA